MNVAYNQLNHGMLGIYIIAALVPAVVLLWFIYKQDKAEKEPVGLLAKLFFLGVLSAAPAVILEEAGQSLITPVYWNFGEIPYLIVLSVLIGIVEEGVKFFFLYRGSWNNPDFNYRFDAVVYAVFVSLGFAALENVLYVVQNGLGTALLRALLAVPGHMAFAVVMGIYYGIAKTNEIRGDRKGTTRNLVCGYVIAVALHAFYDACALTGTVLSVILFVIFVIAMYIIIFRRIRKSSREDTSIFN